WLGQRVTIGSATARIFPRPAIAMRDVRAGDPVRVILANVQLSAGLKPLWSRRIEDAEISVSDTRIDMPLEFTSPAPGGASSASQSPSTGMQVVSIRAIRLRNITVSS